VAHEIGGAAASNHREHSFQIAQRLLEQLGLKTFGRTGVEGIPDGSQVGPTPFLRPFRGHRRSVP